MSELKTKHCMKELKIFTGAEEKNAEVTVTVHTLGAAQPQKSTMCQNNLTNKQTASTRNFRKNKPRVCLKLENLANASFCNFVV